MKVAVITIDPSKRLAKTLGLENDSYKSIHWDSFEQPMDVYFLDAKKEFNKFVENSLSEALYKKIIKNKIFLQISKNLRETHNFAAIYKLDEILSSNKYDLIILDTPPSHQVIEFFESPEKLQKFFTKKNERKTSSIVSWFQDKGLEFVENILMMVTGREFVGEVENFFSYIGKLREEIHNVSQNFLERMRSNKSQLILVGSPALDKINEASHLQQKISKQGYSIRWCVINRAYLADLDLSKGSDDFASAEEEGLYTYFMGQKQKSEQAVRELRKKSYFSGTKFVMMPEVVVKSEDKESLIELSNQVSNFWLV